MEKRTSAAEAVYGTAISARLKPCPSQANFSHRLKPRDIQPGTARRMARPDTKALAEWVCSLSHSP